MHPVNEIDLTAITTKTVTTALTTDHKVQLDLLRLDNLHPIISGNKWFKLRYYIEDALQKGYKKILTFGGPYSNHIIASAYAAHIHNLEVVGIIRGEEPRQWSHTLLQAKLYGMQLHFVPRAVYDSHKRSENLIWAAGQFGDCYIVPEGGMGALGVKGVSAWLQTQPVSDYTHWAVAVGTGTTIAGVLETANVNQQVIGFSSMKNNNALSGEIESLLNRSLPTGFKIVHDYHFGGYGKYNMLLIDWMNDFYSTTGMALDFVYTAKMMYGVCDLLRQGYFPQGAKILAIHTGGLQGNGSLPNGILTF